jgi:hypothetical protein
MQPGTALFVWIGIAAVLILLGVIALLNGN